MIRQTKKVEPEKNKEGLRIITKKYLKDLCHEQGLYTTPSLNDKLYLHFKGFSKIEHLEEYTNLCTLYLENNMIRKIEGLENLKQLRFLYLQKNKISKIENLDKLENLVCLSLAQNHIETIENLHSLKKLETLDLSGNYIMTAKSIEKIRECPSITSLDLSSNEIENDDRVLAYLHELPNLACLYLKNTTLALTSKNYRRRLIYILPKLKYLDTTPVTDDERRTVVAWFRGGREGEMEEKIKMALEKDENIKSYLRDVDGVFSRMNEIRDKELKKLEEEWTTKKNALEKEKERLQRDPFGQEALKKVEEELKIIENNLQNKEKIVDELLTEKTMGVNKFQCMMGTRDENGQTNFLGITSKEFEEYMNDQQLLWLLKQPIQNKKTIENKETEGSQDYEKTLTTFGTRFQFKDNLQNELLHLLDIKAYDFNRVKLKLNEYMNSISTKNMKIDQLLKDTEFRRIYSLVQQISLFLAQNKEI